MLWHQLQLSRLEIELRLPDTLKGLLTSPIAFGLTRGIQRKRLHPEFPIGCGRGGIEFPCFLLISAPRGDFAKRSIAKCGQRASLALSGEAKGGGKFLLCFVEVLRLETPSGRGRLGISPTPHRPSLGAP